MAKRQLAVLGGLMAAIALAGAASGHPTLSGIATVVDLQIEKGQVAGAVTLVATPDKVLHLQAHGLADREANEPMKTDSLFWIASMTKPITGVAVMMLQDDGKLSIDDPVAKYLPELAHLKTKEGAEYPITIKQLLTHTSGMGEFGSGEADTCRTLADAVRIYAGKPLQFVPGSKWQYCQSGINTAGRIIEVVSGLSLPDFLEKRLFGPLGMKDTTFYRSPQQQVRLAKSYARTPDGKLEEGGNPILRQKLPTDRDRFPQANGGLFSTAPDYARFAQMILSGGKLNGKRYLKPESVKALMTVHTDDLKTGFTDGNGWGLGWCVIRDQQGVTAMLSRGSAGHGGAYGTQAWLDPVKKRAYILMVQRANYPNADASDLRRDFQQAAVDALDK
jgi:CubicO group peptidase (beta-lactamase class C family)